MVFEPVMKVRNARCVCLIPGSASASAKACVRVQSNSCKRIVRHFCKDSAVAQIQRVEICTPALEPYLPGPITVNRGFFRRAIRPRLICRFTCQCDCRSTCHLWQVDPAGGVRSPLNEFRTFHRTRPEAFVLDAGPIGMENLKNN